MTKHGARALQLTQSTAVPETETSPSFFQKMINAMGLSFFKYGAVADAYPEKVDAVESLRIRLDRYLNGDPAKNIPAGNTEFLVDVANFAMIEFMHPRHPNAHYKALDSGESPGRAWHGGHVSETANTTDRENNRLGGSSRTTAGGFYRHEGD